MNTPNNAAALTYMGRQLTAQEAVTMFANQEATIRSLRDELATLRASLAQPDALTSQPSGEAVSIPVVQQTAPERIWLAVADDAYYADKPFPDGEEVCWSSDAPLQVCVPYVRADLATHPSADAPGVAVDVRPLDEWREDHGPVTWWRFPIEEAAWIGGPNDSDWPGYHTHWTPHPALPSALSPAKENGSE